MPAAVLVFVVLGALSVDVASVYADQRALDDAAEAAANDAATRAIDLDLAYGGGPTRLVPADAQAVALASVDARRLDRLAATVTDVVVSADGTEVTVRVEGRSLHVFAPALPRGADRVTVRATATAEVVRR
jgi:Flp pilus assembly protein TadG